MNIEIDFRRRLQDCQDEKRPTGWGAKQFEDKIKPARRDRLCINT